MIRVFHGALCKHHYSVKVANWIFSKNPKKPQKTLKVAKKKKKKGLNSGGEEDISVET